MAASKVVSSPSEVAVFGIVATEDGVVAGQAVASEEGAAYEVVAATEEGVVTKGPYSPMKVSLWSMP